jgi:hypothetical protein
MISVYTCLSLRQLIDEPCDLNLGSSVSYLDGRSGSHVC